MTGSASGWETEKAGAGQRVRRLAGEWYEASAATVGRGYDEWYDPVVEELVAGALAGDDVDEALVRLGAARAHVGYGVAEGEADLTALAATLPARARRAVSGGDAAAAFAAGFESVGPGSFPRPRLFGDADDLRERLADLYAREGGGVTAADTHALLTVAAEGDGGAPGEVVHVCGQTIVETFESAERVAWLGGSSFALLVRRHPGLAVGITALETALETSQSMASANLRVGFVALPAGRAGLATLVNGVVDGTLPRRESDDENVERALLDTPLPVSRATEAGSWERAVHAWRSGLSLVSVALVTLLAAVGIARVLGPVSDRFDLTPTTIFGPAAAPVQPERPAGATGVAVAPLSEAPGAASGQPVPRPVTAVAAVTSAPPVAPAPPGRPPATQESSPPAGAPATEGRSTRAEEPAGDEPDSDDAPPCAGLTGKALKHCERDVRMAEPPGERGRAKGHDDGSGATAASTSG